MLRFSDIVFGPIFSRRLGSSLGINLLPPDGKLCNFDCVYCECGWNRDGRVSSPVLPRTAEVVAALEHRLLECRSKGIGIDSITFSGNGEPTLNPDFPDIIDAVLYLRDRYFPQAKVSVLSNATMLANERVFVSLGKVDNPILKIDASTDEGIALVNRPCGRYSLEQTIEALERFQGRFILQTMFLRGEGFDSADKANLEGWMDIVRRLRPRAVMVYTLDRETPSKSLEKMSVEEMQSLVRPLVDEGFTVQVRG